MAGVRLQGNDLRLHASTFPRSDMPHLAFYCTQETCGNPWCFPKKALWKLFGCKDNTVTYDWVPDFHTEKPKLIEKVM